MVNIQELDEERVRERSPTISVHRSKLRSLNGGTDQVPRHSCNVMVGS